jgi:hypothetical protein
MVGFTEYAGEDPETVSASFNAIVNDRHSNTAAGFLSVAFKSRPIASNSWTITINSTGEGEPNWDITELTDVEVLISFVRPTEDVVQNPAGSGNYNNPDLSDCVRMDW